MQNASSNNSNLTWSGWFRRHEFVAAWIIASIAIGGFIWSIKTSVETSNQLKLALDTFTTPMMVVKDVRLIRPKGAPKSCDYPPSEMKINLSYVDHFDLQNSGKFNWVTSKVSPFS